MQRRRFLFCVLGCLPAASLRAADAGERRSFGEHGFTIELPPGYIGPVEHVAGASVSLGFRKPLPQSALNTVIMITVQSNGPAFAQRLAKEREAMTRETLEPVVEGIARNRSGFRSGEPKRVMLSGVAGLKVGWTGSAQGASFDGIVYCVLVGRRAYAIQIQDPAGLGNARMAEAVRAVERMRFRAQ